MTRATVRAVAHAQLTDAVATSPTPVPCTSHPEAWTGEDRQQRQHAARACQNCPVLAACSTYAEHARPTWGIWAGRDRDPLHPVTQPAGQP